VLITRRVKPGQVFMPMHWNDQWSGRARVDALVAPHVDPVSGQPETKYTAVAVKPFAAEVYAYAVSTARPATAAADYWALARVEGGWRAEIALARTPEDRQAWALSVLGVDPADGPLHVMASEDRAANGYRLAVFRGDVLAGALYAARSPVAVDRAWVAEQLGSVTASPAGRMAVLAGRRAADKADPGAVVCTCMFVGANDIRRAIVDQGCATVDAVGACTGAGITCGSCRPEIEVLIADAELREAS